MESKIQKQASMTRKCHIHRLQTNLQHREEEAIQRQAAETSGGLKYALLAKSLP